MGLEVFSQEDASTESVRIVLVGQLVVDTRQELKRKLEELLAAGKSHFVIDMSNCSYVDSAGAGTLVWANRTASEHEGAAVLLNITEQLAKFLHVTKLDTILKVEHSKVA